CGWCSGWSRGWPLDQLGALADAVEGLFEDGSAVGVAAALLHVSQVRLVRLDPGRGRWVGLVGSGRVAAARALPAVRHGRVRREAGPRLVAVGAPEGDPHPRGSLAPLGLAHRAGAYPAATNGIATAHRSPLEERTYITFRCVRLPGKKN